MTPWRTLAAACVFVGAAAPAGAQTCYTAEETRQQLAHHGLIQLHEIVRSVRRDAGGDLISARLCETGDKLVYMIATLDRTGRVVRMTVDARSGDVIHRR